MVSTSTILAVVVTLFISMILPLLVLLIFAIKNIRRKWQEVDHVQ